MGLPRLAQAGNNVHLYEFGVVLESILWVLKGLLISTRGLQPTARRHECRRCVQDTLHYLLGAQACCCCLAQPIAALPSTEHGAGRSRGFLQPCSLLRSVPLPTKLKCRPAFHG